MRQYDERFSPDEARTWLSDKQKEIQSNITAALETVGLDDETQLNYELDETIKSLVSLLKELNAIDRAEIEEMENINASEPDWDAMPGGHDYID